MIKAFSRVISLGAFLLAFTTQAGAAPLGTPDREAPSVSFTSPLSGATVSGTVAVAGHASDNVKVSKLEVKVDSGTYRLATGTTSWSLSLDLGAYASGSHTLTARATDSSGNQAWAGRSITISTTAGKVYWGAFMDGTDTYTHLYGGSWADAPWDANTWNRFESNAGKKVSVLHWGISQPPWVKNFNWWIPALNLVQSRGDINAIDMNSGSVPLRDIANGLYDSSFTTWAQQAKAYGRPFFLRWDWEMNGRWFSWGTTSTNQNTPAEYVAAWRHIHDIFQQVGATNVTWVWCVNHEFTGSVPLEQLYTGDSYVDWTSIDGYNQTPGWWQTFSNIFASTYAHLLQLAPSKPIMVAETSSIESGGSKAGWITDALATQLPQNFPKIKALLWMNWRIYQNGSWWDWEIESSSSAQTAFKTAISSSYYAPGGSFGSLPLLSKITAPA